MSKKKTNRELRNDLYNRCFGEAGSLEAEFVEYRTSFPIKVCMFPPNKNRGLWILVTEGMSDGLQNTPEDIKKYCSPRTELLLFTRQKEDWMILLLERLATFPFAENVYITQSHIIEGCIPKCAGITEFTDVILLPPNNGPGLNKFYIGGVKVDFLAVLPLTAKEREYAEKRGPFKFIDDIANKKIIVSWMEDKSK